MLNLRRQNHSKQTQNCLVEHAGTGDISLEFPSGITTHKSEVADAAGAGPTAGLPNKHVSLVTQYMCYTTSSSIGGVCAVYSVFATCHLYHIDGFHNPTHPVACKPYQNFYCTRLHITNLP